MKQVLSDSAAKVVTNIEDQLTDIERQLEKYVAPTRLTVLQRFPVLFALLTTFGLVMTLLGLELLITEMAWLVERPLLMLAVGVGVLALTGTLYKKL